MARRELEAARAWAVPRSIFLGRIPAPGEPLWLDEDREWAIALLDFEADICSGCGQPASESFDAVNEFAYTTTPSRCHACASMAKTSRAFLDGGSATAGDGLRFHVHHD